MRYSLLFFVDGYSCKKGDAHKYFKFFDQEPSQNDPDDLLEGRGVFVRQL